MVDESGVIGRESGEGKELSYSEAGLYCFPANTNGQMAGILMQQNSAAVGSMDGYGSAAAGGANYTLAVGVLVALVGVVGIMLLQVQWSSSGPSETTGRVNVDKRYGTFKDAAGAHGYALPGNGGADIADAASISASDAVFALLPEPASPDHATNGVDAFESENHYYASDAGECKSPAVSPKSKSCWGAHDGRHSQLKEYPEEMETAFEPAERVPLFSHSRVQGVASASNAIFDALDHCSSEDDGDDCR